ncbi:hypothetical protein BUALT_Bualt10G0129700 [Buddleja alternifolia]|uniref:PGG domain-containing protein n=1 Tax=Buddleja alternifolia TaxID=168488 RepID=A0AAV6WYD7_9LAMI|nr:hypothetical protein BUALT_Bualt10G0129700 [Buddleja alternifolia]
MYSVSKHLFLISQTITKKMEKDLYRATIEGNVEALIKLIQEDPLILDRSMATTFGETPLHVAALLGHQQFTIELVTRKPELARELDSRGSSALHLASAKGHVGIIKALVALDPDMCFLRDKDGRNPIHIAGQKGRIGVLKELLGAESGAARALLQLRGETILHLCVDYCQFDAFQFLVENVDFQDLINCKDSNGNTILHLAVADKQIKTIDYLLDKTNIEVNSANANGQTAMDILVQSRRDKSDIEISEMLQNAGALKSTHIFPSTKHKSPIQTFPTPLSKSNITIQSANSSLASQDHPTTWEQYFNKQDEWLEKQRDSLMVVASLIASMGFTAGLTPPPGVLTFQHRLSAWGIYCRFLIYNTTSFISSLSIILLLVSGIPVRRRVFMWILMVIMWIAVSSTALTYAVSIETHTNSNEFTTKYGVLLIGVIIWLFLMTMLLVFHTARFGVMFAKKFKKVSSRGDNV